MISLSDITQWIHKMLFQYLNGTVAYGAELVLAGVAVIALVVAMAIIMVYAERKFAGFFQMRWGPNRVGKWGTLQAIADTVKLMLKECITPNNADKPMFKLAPIIITVVGFLALAPFAFAKGIVLWDMNIGVFYVTAISSLSVIGILMGGWASNNKYSLLGALRSGAQIVSYELSAGLSIAAIIVMSGSMSLNDIILAQTDGWWILRGHIPAIIAFVISIIASTAEANRSPFDLAEGEQELTGGYHTEYSGIQFALFFLAEYTTMFILAMLNITLFLGGWMPFHIPGLTVFNHIMDFIPGIVWFFGKTFFILFLMIWFRWTFPRMRIDKLLKLEWKYLLPISIVNLLFAAFITLMGWHF
ncbi:MAG: NADH-quinone oxidoreductase subunit NuoH [Bacteroidota bacterium]|nr:NADH-quinone oxidoreductase subunit NuoH [Bacteroidota bacterium]MDP4205353.1 NADH-quinone oxidoreductase subunit NuoH [Bacteroidota bacterium]